MGCGIPFFGGITLRPDRVIFFGVISSSSDSKLTFGSFFLGVIFSREYAGLSVSSITSTLIINILDGFDFTLVSLRSTSFGGSNIFSASLSVGKTELVTIDVSATTCFVVFLTGSATQAFFSS